MNILGLYEMNISQILCFMHKCKIGLIPSIFQNIFTLQPVNKYVTRSRPSLIKPLCKTKFEQFNITFRGPHLWNNLIVNSPKLNNIDHFPLFKMKIKDLLLESNTSHFF